MEQVMATAAPLAVEMREFDVDKAILHSIIKSQAGSLPKALLEGIMNSIDAGATNVSVTVTREGFTIMDDGRGFQSLDEIVKWFGRFGTPHEEGDATYGRFRIGRGQLMAFAQNTWRTGTFQMDVDIKNRGMGYELKKNLRPIKGCRIAGKLYTPLSEHELSEVLKDFTLFVRYSQIPVRLNGKVISENPTKLKWDLETDEAYIKIDREAHKQMEVYNLGVFVVKYSNWKFGCGGVVVSKKPLELNTARNDILLYQCKVWPAIEEFVKQANLRQVAGKGKLNDGERAFLATTLRYENTLAEKVDTLDLKLVTDITGRNHSIKAAMTLFPKLSTCTEKQARVATKLHQKGAAFMVSAETLSRFEVKNVEELVDVLARISKLPAPEVVSFAKVAEGFSERYSTIPDDQVGRDEGCALFILRQFHEKYFEWYSSKETSSGMRELRVGSSNVAGAWTDGQTYITLDIGVLTQAVKKGAAGFMSLLTLLTHEYVHDDADLESHDHDLHFYMKFHDLLLYPAGTLMKLAVEMDKALTKLRIERGLLAKPLKSAKAAARPTARPMSKKQQLQYEERTRQAVLPL